MTLPASVCERHLPSSWMITDATAPPDPSSSSTPAPISLLRQDLSVHHDLLVHRTTRPRQNHPGQGAHRSLEGQGIEPFHVDGDDLRALTSNADYSRAGREANIRRAQTIAHYLHNQDRVVVVSLVAPYRSCVRNSKPRRV